MLTILFWILSAVMLASAVSVVAFRNPVNSAMSLVLAFLALAGLFVTLDAFFIGIIQVLVYAGAVMVLFLFIIMLLDLKAEARRKLNLAALAGGLAVLGGFVLLVAQVVKSLPASRETFPELAATAHSDVADVGMTLFSGFNLPFQVIGVLLLVSTVGVVILSRRTLR
ncbi:MAG: NADH-quinone oxidoreductase subunit J [Chthoniobacterales bacterium]|jgi:NADH-quinone oxidoreductase subunit J|nr:NADH-quinone oxidoreductase subunit J [Chthoniobacterales bacterium]